MWNGHRAADEGQANSRPEPVPICAVPRESPEPPPQNAACGTPGGRTLTGSWPGTDAQACSAERWRVAPRDGSHGAVRTTRAAGTGARPSSIISGQGESPQPRIASFPVATGSKIIPSKIYFFAQVTVIGGQFGEVGDPEMPSYECARGGGEAGKERGVPKGEKRDKGSAGRDEKTKLLLFQFSPEGARLAAPS